MAFRTMSRRHAHSTVLDFDPASPAPLRLAVTPFDGSHPGVRQPPHSHRFFEIIYIESGHGTHRTGDVEAAAEPGDVFAVSPGTTHDPSGLATVQGYVLLFSARALDPRFTDADFAFTDDATTATGAFRFLRTGAHSGMPLRVPAEERGLWRARLQSIADELTRRAPGYEELTRAELRILLLHGARLAAPPDHLAADGAAPCAAPCPGPTSIDHGRDQHGRRKRRTR